MEVATARTRMPAQKSGIVWIASYPKSGNTWVRSFLHNLANVMYGGDPDAEVKINALDRFSTWEIGIDRYTRALGFQPTAEHRARIAAIRPSVQQLIADEGDGMIFVKTHHALVTDRGHPTINVAVTAGAVYILRNPLDVAISFADHRSTSIDETIDAMATDDVETDINERAVHEVFGSWSQHVLSWTRHNHPAIHVMRYEDMLADPHASFGRLLKHLNLAATPQQLANAIERSSFRNLRAQEDAEGFREKPAGAERFFREGRAGQWKDVLTPAQIKRIVDRHRTQMARFGYLPNDV